MKITVEKQKINWTFQVSGHHLNLINCFYNDVCKRWVWRSGTPSPKPYIPQDVRDAAIEEYTKFITVT